jgi:hypothetical protein
MQVRRIGLVGAHRCCGLREGDSGGVVIVLLRDFVGRREERVGIYRRGPTWARD